MSGGAAVRKYQLGVTLRDGIAQWSLAVETDDGQRHVAPVRDGEEVPVLLDLLRHDKTVYYDPEQCLLRTGWNVPGAAEGH